MDDAAEIADEIFENEGVQNFLVEMEMESGIDVSDLPDHIIEESRWEALFTLVAETIGE
jgi:hypothetical protein